MCRERYVDYLEVHCWKPSTSPILAIERKLESIHVPEWSNNFVSHSLVQTVNCLLLVKENSKVPPLLFKERRTAKPIPKTLLKRDCIVVINLVSRILLLKVNQPKPKTLSILSIKRWCWPITMSIDLWFIILNADKLIYPLL